MKYLYNIFTVLFLFTFSSCETEVDLDLKTIEPRLVIDAAIASKRPCTVRLSLTQDYWDQGTPTPVKGAKVTLTNEEGRSEVLHEFENEGYYVSRALGVTGKSYTITVECDDEIYKATEVIPSMVPIDKISIYTIDTGGDKFYFPYITFTDPKEHKNYYYYILAINGKTMTEARFDDDKHSNGLIKEPILAFDKEENNDEELKVGDRINVEMHSVGEGAYSYYESIKSQGGTASSNPKSNFSGDVLGMFKTYCPSFIEMTITEEDLAE